MRIDIKLSKRTRLRNRECYGVTRFISDNRAIIYISESANKDIGTYALTLIHELLHVWLAMLKAVGSKIDLRKDHTFINSVEKAIIRLSKRLKRRSK
jgi:hypothetical protein